MNINTNKLDYEVENFDVFLKANWSDLVEYAEEATGEQYDGREPLLSKDEIIEIAKEIWRENKREELNSIILPEEINKEEYVKVIDYLLTIGLFDN